MKIAYFTEFSVFKKYLITTKDTIISVNIIILIIIILKKN